MDDIYAINLAKTEFREGYNTGDVGRVLSAFSEGLVDMSADEPAFYGPEAYAVMRHRLEHLFSAYQAEMKVIISEIKLLGEMAWDWGWHVLTLTPRDGGETTTQRFRYSEMWVRTPDGQWKIVFFMTARDLPPAMPPFPWPPEKAAVNA